MGTESSGTPAFKWKAEEGKPVETEETIRNKKKNRRIRTEQCHKAKGEERNGHKRAYCVQVNEKTEKGPPALPTRGSSHNDPVW